MIFKERKEFTFVSNALSEDTFSVVKFSGVESISRPFEFDIMLASEDSAIDLKAVLQNSAKLMIKYGDTELPYGGILAKFEQLHEVKQHAFYRAVMVPKLWNASLYHENQLFLDKAVPKIIEEVLKQSGLTGLDYELKLTRSYPDWEYICQYRETDLDFISRWMEREGIYYFFEQTEQGAKMVITDSSSAHQDIKGDTAVSYSPPSGLIPSEEGIVKEFGCRQRILPAKVILKDYNYRKPSLEAKAEAEVDPNGRANVYIYEEHFKDPGQGKDLAKIRAEELLCREKEFYGGSTAPAFSPGFTFELSGHYRNDYNQKYLITEVMHEGSRTEDLLAGLSEKSAGEEEISYSNRFVCIPADTQFRPERRTPKPKFYGTMNAVVDAAGDGKFAELDDQGRYKVILPFDLSGRKDGKASRFIRMAQPYSGYTATDGVKGPSGMHFPLHKGAEVLLTFVDGDPDRPIISSAIPNPETVSPVTDANQTQSAIRDYYGNELIFDSTPGDEHIRLYSPHHSSGFELGRSLMKWTKSDESEFVTGNKLEAVFGNRGDFLIGNALDLKAGQFWDVKLGFGTEALVGGGVTFNWAYDLRSNKGPIVNTTAKDILSAAGKDQILSAGDQVCIIGGESAGRKMKASQVEFAEKAGQFAEDIGLKDSPRQPPHQGNRSIVNVFPEKLILSVGEKKDTYKISDSKRTPVGSAKTDEIFSKTPPTLGLLFAAVFPAVIGVTEFVASAVIDMKHDEYRGAPGIDNQKIGYLDGVRSVEGAMGAMGGAMSAMAVWWMLRKYLHEKAIEPVGQKDPASKMELDHEGKVLVNSREKSIVVRVGKNEDKDMEGSGLRIDKDAVLIGRGESLNSRYSQKKSRLKLEKSGNVFLVAEKKSVIKAESSIQLVSRVFHGPGGNLKVIK